MSVSRNPSLFKGLALPDNEKQRVSGRHRMNRAHHADYNHFSVFCLIYVNNAKDVICVLRSGGAARLL